MNKTYLATNQWNYRLVDFIYGQSEEIITNRRLDVTCVLGIVECNKKILLVKHRERNHWELPGGSKEKIETPRQGALREIFEETNQVVNNVKYIGVGKLINDNKGRVEYLALYHGEIEEVREFQENDEIERILLWDYRDELVGLDSINEYILRAFIEQKNIK